MSAPGLFRPPAPQNEPVKDYAPGSPERAEPAAAPRPAEQGAPGDPARDRRRGRHHRDDPKQAMPHDKEHVLADVHQGGAAEVERAIAAAGEAWEDWHRTPWEERAAVFLRAAELLAGPWRDTLVAATMLGQSKTAHQAEIDAAAELIDFWRWNVEFMLRIYAEQPVSSPGVWNRMEYRPLEGFVFAVTPFNFTAIAGNLPGSYGADGQHGRLETGDDRDVLRVLADAPVQEAGLPPGVINLVYGSGAEIGDAALDSETSPASTSPARRRSSTRCGRRSAATSPRYRNYPRIVGETGGKDFIVAHPSADVDALATAILRGSFEYQGQKCSAASRVYAPLESLARPPRKTGREGGRAQDGRRRRLRELHGRGDRPEVARDTAQRDRGCARERRQRDRRRWRRRRQSRLLRGADRDRDEGPEVPDDAGGAVRPGRDDVRLPRGQVDRDARPRRVDLALRADRRGLLGGPALRSTRPTRRFATRPGTST